MRIRVRSVGPLPSVKAWYEVSVGAMEPKTVADLKNELCQTVFGHEQDMSVTAANIIIELDEFELLDNSSLNVVHENDLLV